MTAVTAEEDVRTKGSDIVAIEDLHKAYKGGTKALQGLNLKIQAGDLFGIIGPDGAGKTTALNIICGVMEATSGKILIDGKKPNMVREQIGYVPQNGALYPELTVEESLLYEAGLHNVSDSDYKKRRELYLKKMGLLKFTDRLTSKLSGGMKQKLALCCALISQPKLLVLDEPTNGLDPVSRRELWQALAELTQDGMTAIVATPFLDEAERCTNVALLYEGKVHQSGSPKDLKEALHLTRLDLRVGAEEEANKDQKGKADESADDSKTTSRLTDLSIGLNDLASDNIVDVVTYGDRVEVLAKDIDKARDEVKQILEKQKFKASDERQAEPSMENVFIMRLRELGVKEDMPKPFPRSEGSSAKSGSAISAKDLNKRFDKFEAVKNVNLELHYGEIYGLLGANGAGKTTTIKMLCGLLAPTSGQVTLAGESGNLRSRKVRKSIGYMSQKFTLYDSLTVQENLEFYASIYEIPKSEHKKKLDWAIEACNLSQMTKSIVGRLPRGWKQRIAFGAAVMHEPDILFLDEPTAGVDPIARRQIWSLVRQLAKQGAAVLVTTHYLEEAEYCSRMSLMSASTVVAQGSPSQIEKQCQGVLYELKVDNIQKAFLALSDKLEPWRVSIFGSTIHLLLNNENEADQVKQTVSQCGETVRAFERIPFSLEDAFIAIVQESQRKQA